MSSQDDEIPLSPVGSKDELLMLNRDSDSITCKRSSQNVTSNKDLENITCKKDSDKVGEHSTQVWIKKILSVKL